MIQLGNSSKIVFRLTERDIVCIPVDSLVYIEADGNYSKLYTLDNRVILITTQLGTLLKDLAYQLQKTNNLIIRVGRSHIINMKYVHRVDITRGKLTLSDCISYCKEIQLSENALISISELITELDNNDDRYE